MDSVSFPVDGAFVLSWTPPHISHRWTTDQASNQQLRFQIAVVDFTCSFDDKVDKHGCGWTSEVIQASATGAFFTLPPEVCHARPCIGAFSTCFYKLNVCMARLPGSSAARGAIGGEYDMLSGTVRRIYSLHGPFIPLFTRPQSISVMRR